MQVQIVPAVTVTFAEVDLRGATGVTTSTGGPPAPPGFQPRATLCRTTSRRPRRSPARSTSASRTTRPRTPATRHTCSRSAAAGWSDVTTTVGPSAVCGRASSLGTFAVFAGDPSPPAITPHVTGQLGANGWYTGDVTVTWDVADAQSQISATTGCDATTINTDTAATTLTCSATSDGGTASVSVTVKRDATAPTITCKPTPSTLWPPNGKLVPVTVAVTVADATSGPGGLVLTAETTSGGNARNRHRRLRSRHARMSRASSARSAAATRQTRLRADVHRSGRRRQHRDVCRDRRRPAPPSDRGGAETSRSPPLGRRRHTHRHGIREGEHTT